MLRFSGTHTVSPAASRAHIIQPRGWGGRTVFCFMSINTLCRTWQVETESKNILLISRRSNAPLCNNISLRDFSSKSEGWGFTLRYLTCAVYWVRIVSLQKIAYIPYFLLLTNYVYKLIMIAYHILDRCHN